jgi:hypothetical protein
LKWWRSRGEERRIGDAGIVIRSTGAGAGISLALETGELTLSALGLSLRV